MGVYTKTGDKGKTGIFNGKRVSKSSKLIQAIGAIDELNSYLGVVGGLTEIQKNLFTINAILARSDLAIPKDAIKKLEREIDDMEGKMPVLANFIIYSGTPRAVKMYYARSLTRRAERALVAVPNILHTTYYILPYLNRLSDYLFTLARFTNFKGKIKEEVWKITS
ncbi:MAG: cob(I)yrinic acid a,c-diamide adenosyltransferase [Candidatus Woesebacteria bacterium]|nr:cob(I)yrinic acid a,c-diamide adenosyltransferase [Candidatus Woesebacteria bacterium]